MKFKKVPTTLKVLAKNVYLLKCLAFFFVSCNFGLWQWSFHAAGVMFPLLLIVDAWVETIGAGMTAELHVHPVKNGHDHEGRRES